MQQVGQTRADELGRRLAAHGLAGRADVLDEPVGRENGDDVGRVLDKRAEALLARGQLSRPLADAVLEHPVVGFDLGLLAPDQVAHGPQHRGRHIDDPVQRVGRMDHGQCAQRPAHATECSIKDPRDEREASAEGKPREHIALGRPIAEPELGRRGGVVRHGHWFVASIGRLTARL
jgi:hypothetical protein